MPLTDTECRKAIICDRPKKLSDGGGLFLLVQPSGSKLWRLAYRYQGRQKTLALGKYPTVSLKEARQKREAAKSLIDDNIDPSEEKKRAKKLADAAENSTFESVAMEWLLKKRPAWTSGYSDRLEARLRGDLISELGHRPIAEIEPPELLAAVRKIEERGAVVLAKRMLQISGQIFRYAIATGLATRDPTQDLRGALASSPPPKRRASLKAAELPEFLSKLDNYDGDHLTRLGLKLVVHTFVRTAELRFACWHEFENLETTRPVWRIPAERMKMRSEHIVPLSHQALEIFRSIKALKLPGSFVFPGRSGTSAMSQNTMIYALYRLGYHSRATVHGFRGTASTVLNEHGFNRDWIERQLAHSEGNDVRAAYNSAEYLDQRKEMMQWWSDYLDNQANKPGK